MRAVLWLFPLVVASLLVGGCAGTRHLAPDELLIRGNVRFKGVRQLDSDLAASAIRTKPNRRILLPKVYLHFWALGTTLKTDSSFFFRTVRRVAGETRMLAEAERFFIETAGEPPAVANPRQLDADAENLASIYFGQGFLHAKVRWRVTPRRGNPLKANVTFYVEENEAFRYRDILYDVPDSTVAALLLRYRGESRLRPGARYNESTLDEERSRIANLLREHGYYTIAPLEVSYLIDTTVGLRADSARGFQNLANAVGRGVLGTLFGTRERIGRNDRPVDVTIKVRDLYTAYHISDISVEMLYALDDTTGLVDVYAPDLTPADRDRLDLPIRRLEPDVPYHFRTVPRVLGVVNLNTVADQIGLRTGDTYDQTQVRAAQRRLQELGMFKNVVIRMVADDSTGTLRARILLTLLDRFSFRVGFEAFQTEDVRLSSNLPGVGANLTFAKRNAFRRGERLNTRLNGSLSFYRPDPDENGIQKLQVFYQYGIQTQIFMPRLVGIAPLVRNWRRLYTPTTSIGLNFQTENPLDFRRTTFTLDYTYQGFHSVGQPQWRSVFTPLSLQLVNSFTTDGFTQRILDIANDDPILLVFILRDFEPRFNSRTSYYLTFSDNYGTLRTRPTFFCRAGAEVGGNLPFLADVIGRETGQGDGSLQDTKLNGRMRYGQFVKSSLEMKAYIPFWEHSELVFRTFVGYATGYNHTQIIPLENRFYAGGTNSVRGWQANTLGPGIFPPTGNAFIALGGEYKLEMNAEFRRDLISPVELAVFVDAGNVWFSSTGGFDDPRGRLSSETLRLGLSTGVGVRLDFDFVIIRLDVGQQLYAPDLERPVVRQFRDIGNSRIQYNLAIGYPF